MEQTGLGKIQVSQKHDYLLQLLHELEEFGFHVRRVQKAHCFMWTFKEFHISSFPGFLYKALHELKHPHILGLKY